MASPAPEAEKTGKGKSAEETWNDPDVGIDRPIKDPILSAKDSAAPRLAELMSRLPVLEAGPGEP